MRIRSVESEEMETLQQLSISTFYETFGVGSNEEDTRKYIGEAFSVSQLTKEFQHPKSAFFFVEYEGEVAGYLKLNEDEAQTETNLTEGLEIQRIYIQEKFQGKGIGRFLMENSKKIAQQKRKTFVWLGVWEENVKAIAFYTKNGFEIFDEHIFMLGDDAQRDVLMRCNL